MVLEALAWKPASFLHAKPCSDGLQPPKSAVMYLCPLETHSPMRLTAASSRSLGKPLGVAFGNSAFGQGDGRSSWEAER